MDLPVFRSLTAPVNDPTRNVNDEISDIIDEVINDGDYDNAFATVEVTAFQEGTKTVVFYSIVVQEVAGYSEEVIVP